ncbi:methyltransferase domain-containing protein [Anaeromyxobacter oryzae]|uniref:Arsenite methyltransferase n=1 Tax=Anaeromyxobacter oryzae TaxID=2918170 RepID=A0ABN6MMH1_9BACT|nr:methyltransferase domain-containing protein [Anaeromyxobacter oryzae]BDG02243.1 arsenite S-adenosylmethyltransferase [Anaeromyxobacter oryzae]
MALPGDPPPPADLQRALETRYGALAATTQSLSCGSVLELAALRDGETVVDLGCGRGGDVLRAAAAVGDRGVAIGVDSSPAMIAAARAPSADRHRIRFLLGDLAAVPLPDGAADAVVSSCAINHAPDKPAVYREIRRLLRPGGRFVVADVVSERPLPDAVRGDPAAWAACYGGAIPEADYLAAIAGAGLADVSVLRRSAPYERGGVRILSITVAGMRP